MFPARQCTFNEVKTSQNWGSFIEQKSRGALKEHLGHLPLSTDGNTGLREAQWRIQGHMPETQSCWDWNLRIPNSQSSVWSFIYAPNLKKDSSYTYSITSGSWDPFTLCLGSNWNNSPNHPKTKIRSVLAVINGHNGSGILYAQKVSPRNDSSFAMAAPFPVLFISVTPCGTMGSGYLVSVPGSWRTALTALGISRVIRQPFAWSWVTRVWAALGSVRTRGGLQKGRAMTGGRELSAPSPVSREWGRVGDWINHQWPLLSSVMPS